MTTLDALYASWAADQSEGKLNDLIQAVRDRAQRYFRQFGSKAEDIAQDVSVIVFSKLPAFQPQSDAAFSHWLNSIMRRERMSRYDDHPHISSEAMPEQVPEHDRYVDISGLPPFMKECASYFVMGHSIEETAELMKMKPATLRKKLQRYRDSVTKS